MAERLHHLSPMLGLLALLASGLLVGKLARRVTPAAEVLLLGIVTAIVLLEFASLSRTSGGSTVHEMLEWILPGIR
jgi:hypothetical protein